MSNAALSLQAFAGRAFAGRGICGTDGSTPQELLASGGTPGHIFLRPSDDYLRLFTDGKISLDVPKLPETPCEGLSLSCGRRPYHAQKENYSSETDAVIVLRHWIGRIA